MAEYTEREALLNSICYETCGIAFCGATNCAFIAKICSAPAADVSQVVHGRWIGAPLCGNDNCRCSECGSWHNIHANLRGEIMQKYCPNCGAKMDGGDNDAAD